MKRGFTLIEILVVLAILGILFSFSAPLSNWKNSSPRLAAEELASALKLARSYAIEHGTFARVAFANADLALHTTNYFTNAFGIYVFYVPQTDSTNFSAGYVGQWIPLPNHPDWHQLKNINIPFTNEASDAATLKKLYFNPAQCWKAYETNYFSTNYGGSFFPTNFWQTPFPTSYPFLQQTNGAKYFDVSAPTHFFNLRGIEFNSQGKPTFSSTNHLTVRMIDSENTNHYYDVVVDQMSGMIQLKGP